VRDLHAGVLELAGDGSIHAAAHITGGGIAENVPRALPPGLGARIRLGSWPEPPIFGLLRRVSRVRGRLFSTFNMGVGMVLVAAPEHVEGILRRSPDRTFVIGENQRGNGYRARGRLPSVTTRSGHVLATYRSPVAANAMKS